MDTKPQTPGRARHLAIAAAVAVLAGCLTASAVVHVFPFSSGAPSGQSGQLLLLLPGSLSQDSSGCHDARAPGQWSTPGLVEALHCTDPGLAGGNIYAYQLDSAANFQAAWRGFNQWWGFLPGRAGPACPPKAAASGVMVSAGAGPAQAGRQVTECGTMPDGNGHVPAYAWDLPNSDAFFIAQGAPGSSFSALESWLTGPATLPFRLPAGVAQLAQLLPSGVVDPMADCRALDWPWDWDMPGLVRDLECTDPNLPHGQVYAFQLSSTANYLASWQNFNKWWGSRISAAGPDCPPSGNVSQGLRGWSSGDFPAHSGQVVECGMLGSGASAVPAYAYAMPTEDAFFVAQGEGGSSFAMLSTWWSNESMPAAAQAAARPGT